MNLEKWKINYNYWINRIKKIQIFSAKKKLSNILTKIYIIKLIKL